MVGQEFSVLRSDFAVPRHMPLIRFFAEIDRQVDRLFNIDDSSPFTLVLGAGASRSAGIPVTSEMIKVLQKHIDLRWPGYPTDVAEGDQNAISALLGTIYEMTCDDWEIREFFQLCVRRGSREPNLAHLIAANLACTGVFRPIVTTNFDDLALAGFWNLPPNEAYSEPYVIYDPRTVRLAHIRLGEDTPIIIKAHGHYTQYGVGIVEAQIRQLAPFVKRIIRSFGSPRVGYIVVGCSGAWQDGVIDTLKDRRLTRGKTIYWFYREKVPDLKKLHPLRELAENSDVCFIRCDDPDYLFLKLWNFFKDSGMRGSAWVLDEYDLFAPPTTAERLLYREYKTRRWWKPQHRHRIYLRPELRERVPDNAPEIARRLGTRSQARRDMGIADLRRKLLPIILEIEKWDREYFLPYDCLPRHLRRKFDPMGFIEESGGEAPALEKLRDAISPLVPWTRRNRHLLKIALAPHTDPHLSFSLLKAIDEIGKR